MPKYRVMYDDGTSEVLEFGEHAAPPDPSTFMKEVDPAGGLPTRAYGAVPQDPKAVMASQLDPTRMPEGAATAASLMLPYSRPILAGLGSAALQAGADKVAHGTPLNSLKNWLNAGLAVAVPGVPKLMRGSIQKGIASKAKHADLERQLAALEAEIKAGPAPKAPVAAKTPTAIQKLEKQVQAMRGQRQFVLPEKAGEFDEQLRALNRQITDQQRKQQIRTAQEKFLEDSTEHARTKGLVESREKAKMELAKMDKTRPIQIVNRFLPPALIGGSHFYGSGNAGTSLALGGLVAGAGFGAHKLRQAIINDPAKYGWLLKILAAPTSSPGQAIFRSLLGVPSEDDDSSRRFRTPTFVPPTSER